MIDTNSPAGYRCRACGRFCGCTYEWRGPSYTEVTHCENCCEDPSCFCNDGADTDDKEDSS